MDDLELDRIFVQHAEDVFPDVLHNAILALLLARKVVVVARDFDITVIVKIINNGVAAVSAGEHILDGMDGGIGCFRHNARFVWMDVEEGAGTKV